MSTLSLRSSAYLLASQLLLGGWVTACGSTGEHRATSGDGGASGSPGMSPEECRAVEQDAVPPIARDLCVAHSDCTEFSRATDCLLICGWPMTKRQREETTRWFEAFEAERCTGTCTDNIGCTAMDYGRIYCLADGHCAYATDTRITLVEAFLPAERCANSAETCSQRFRFDVATIALEECGVEMGSCTRFTGAPREDWLRRTNDDIVSTAQDLAFRDGPQRADDCLGCTDTNSVWLDVDVGAREPLHYRFAAGSSYLYESVLEGLREITRGIRDCDADSAYRGEQCPPLNDSGASSIPH